MTSSEDALINSGTRTARANQKVSIRSRGRVDIVVFIFVMVLLTTGLVMDFSSRYVFA